MKKLHALFKASFRAKVLTSFIVCMVAVMTVTLLVVNHVITQQTRREARNTLTTANAVFLNSERVRIRNLLQRFRTALNETRGRDAFTREPSRALSDSLQRLMTRQGVDIIFFTIYTNGVQQVLDCEERDLQFSATGFESAAMPAVHEAYQNQVRANTVDVGRQLYDVVAIPIHDADNTVLGVLTIGARLGQGVAQDFSSITSSKIVFLADGHVVASTLSSAQAKMDFSDLYKNMVPAGSTGDDSNINVEPVVLDGEHYYGIGGRFDSQGADASIGYMLLNSSEASLRAAAEAKHLLLGVSFAAILVGAGIIWLLVRRVTLPLLELHDSAEAVGRGDFTRRVKVHESDELGRLARAFNHMTSNIQQSRRELEHIVATLQNTQQQLIQSEKLSAVGEFVAGVAHELNNPLAAVMGFSEILKESDTDPKNRRHLDVIFKSAVRCRKIVQSLLSFSRRHLPERRPVCVNNIVEAVLEIIAYPLRTSNVEVVTQFDGNLPVVFADDHQIQQVVLNVINNARQAIEEHGKEPQGLIRIITEASPETVRILIHDNGPGIPEDHLARIFDPFFTTKKVGSGTGLGLSLCYGIVREHGGTIMALNRPGGGATFIIELPAMHLPGDTTELLRAPEAKHQSHHECAGKKILIIDDEPSIVDMLRESLNGHGYEVDVAGDGRRALEQLDQKSYDVTFCDWKMPGLNGRQVYETLLSRQPEACRSFIFISGDVINEPMRGFLARENRLCLAKPFTQAQVRDAIESTLAEN